MPSPPRAVIANSTRPLRVLKRADARRDARPIVVLLASSATQSDACLSARPAGRSGRSALCVMASRQVPTCLRNHALIASRPERQRACGVDYYCPSIPRAPDYAALRVRCVARFIGVAGEVSHKTRGLCPLRHPVALFPDKSALLARVNGTNPSCTLHRTSVR